MTALSGPLRRSVALLAVALTACGTPTPDRSSAVAAPDTLAPQPLEARVDSTLISAPLSPAADSIAAFLVFAPRSERWFLVASRGKRALLDLGRVDTDVARDSTRRAAYESAVHARSPWPVGTPFRVRGAFGERVVTIDRFTSWNGRIVARLSMDSVLDAAARAANFVASAERLDSLPPADTVAVSSPDSAAMPPKRVGMDSCWQGKLPAPIAARLTAVRDSLRAALESGPRPPYERLQRRVAFGASQVTGCFGAARAAIVAHQRAGDVEWVRELAVLVDSAGAVTPITFNDLRFRAHELLGAFDADGDGVWDLTTRATTERAGATTVLRLDLAKRRAQRWTQGFAWERM
ncbi:MAG: hypothetical protein K2X99_03175 [Gemmatimonadaceae bacterium]|nr:hypothetical protein [Gemmatimonadaceae bacterium]